MKLAIIGYGKMGKLIEEQAQARGHEVVARLNSSNNSDGSGLRKEALSGIDVCIDFSTPAVVINNIRGVVDAGIPIVVGTTGWTDGMGAIKGYVNEHKGALVYGSYFSFGMNVFFRVVANAAKLLAASDSYDLFMIEQH